MKNIYNKIAGLFSITLVVFGALAPSVLAEEIVISGNGADSTSQVSSTTTQQTTVTQSNNADITNNVTTDANTGNNTASNNTGGDTAISTGDINTTTGVSNTGNVSVADVGRGCDCPITSSTIISGNGAGSTNTVNTSNIDNNRVSVNQIANVTNNLVTNADTGNNTASGNNGNVSIVTGNIYAKTSLTNGPLNISRVKVSQGKNVDRLLKIAGNGVSIINTINNTDTNSTTISVNNIANFLNNITNDYNTGGNTANDNVGDVSIATGDIWAEIKVTNLANISEVIVDCGCKPKPGEEKPPLLPPGIVTSPPSPTSSSVGGPSPASGSSTASQAVAAAIGGLLPATGGSWLFFALLGNIMMFLLGAYLRLRSGRGPGLAIA